MARVGHQRNRVVQRLSWLCKVTVQEKTEVLPIELSVAKFAHVHVDLVRPLPVSQKGHNHLLTVVDRLTRWPEAIPMRTT